MSEAARPDRGAIAFAEKLLTVLGEGRFTATYKYAVILAFMDLCLEYSTRAGAAPESVTTRQLAEKVLELYWPHAMPFRGQRVLRQNAGSQAAILSSIVRFREGQGAQAVSTLLHARSQAPEAVARLTREIEWILVKMPLPKLQRVGRELMPFFYEIRWDDEVSEAALRGSDFDNLIRFAPGASDYLVRLAGLLRPLVQREWAALVARLNDDLVGEPELEEFLFGASRVALVAVRGDLRELQDGLCFYCAEPLRDRADVDHFIPWARYPDDGLENLVVAHSGCNGAKSDHLAAADHVARWVARAVAHATDLATIASRHTWDRHPEKNLAVARAIYLRLPEDARLWRLADEFVPLDRDRLREAFAAGAPGAVG